MELRVDTFSTFEELYKYWKEAERVQTTFTAIVLSTEIAGLDKKITNFIIDHKNELTDMSGKSCAVFMETPIKNFTKITTLPYKEISYSVANLLKVTPDKFPSIVFFDNLIRPKKMVLVTLAEILNSESSDDELASFFRALFTITQECAASKENRLNELEKAIQKKWKTGKQSNVDFTKIAETTLSITEIGKNISGIALEIMNRFK